MGFCSQARPFLNILFNCWLYFWEISEKCFLQVFKEQLRRARVLSLEKVRGALVPARTHSASSCSVWVRIVGLANIVVSYSLYYHMSGCQNYSPFLGPKYNTAPSISGTQNGDHSFDTHTSASMTLVLRWAYVAGIWSGTIGAPSIWSQGPVSLASLQEWRYPGRTLQKLHKPGVEPQAIPL